MATVLSSDGTRTPIQCDDVFQRIAALYQWKIRARSDGVVKYAERWANAKRRWISFHQMVWETFHGPVPDGFLVDHADNDGLNCRNDNLRLSTTRDNNRNRRKFKNSTSEYKGVERLPSGSYRARIVIDGSKHTLGTFDTAEAAARAYDTAARGTFGEFAQLNFPAESAAESQRTTVG